MALAAIICQCEGFDDMARFALLRKLALNLLRADTTVRGSIRGKRLQATFSEEILETFLRLRPSK